ncbi:MAG: transketolase [Opitutales bacterium]|nr:transketolase [Opitutales bacterium]
MKPLAQSSVLPPKSIGPDPLSSETLSKTLRVCYEWMHFSRIMDQRLMQLFRQGLVQGTMVGGDGNEGLIVPLTLLLDRERDVISFTHRDLAGKLIWSRTVREHICHYLANAGSPTQAREGNVHYGDPANRSYPMISHLGSMVSLVVGGTDSQRRKGENAIGVALFGDGGSSTGDIHETMNLAAVYQLPILFIVENNEYAYSTPTGEQFAVKNLADRARGYGFAGETLDIQDTAHSLTQLHKAVEFVRRENKPYFIEAKVLRLSGHAAYDTADYIPSATKEGWAQRDALPRLRKKVVELFGEEEIVRREKELADYLEEAIASALQEPEAEPGNMLEDVFSPTRSRISWQKEEPAKKLTLAQGLNKGLHKIMRESPEALVIGQDIADYGGPFKVTENLFQKFGRERVINCPLAESATVGHATGLALNGHRPIIEFQFADFATDATTQIVLNAATFHFRAGAKVPLVLRYPCGGGLTFGSFHSQELEALYLQFPGLKVLYPSTPQDAYNALLAAYEDDNPVLLFEHKKLYRQAHGDVQHDPNYQKVWKPRLVREGSEATWVTYGDMVRESAQALDTLTDEFDFTADLFDLRALNPLDLTEIKESLALTRRLIVVHEARRTCGFGAELVSRLTEELFFDLEAPPLRLTPPDMPVPFAPALEKVYRPDAASITGKVVAWWEQNQL